MIQLFGQLAWAGSQAAIVVALSHLERHSALGLYMIALSVFTPLCLLGGLNLRLALAVDRQQAISVRDAVAVRTFTTIAAFLLTGGSLFLVGSGSDALLAIVLLIARIGDYLSDVVIGTYQRGVQARRISLSFAARGVVGMALFGGVLLSGGNPLAAAAASSAGVMFVCVAIDVYPALQKTRALSWTGIRLTMRQARGVGSFPFFDNLHFNSLRYGILAVSTVSFVGYLGVAQTLFVPFQLAATALGYGYLHRDKVLRDRGDISALRRHTTRGALLGAAIGLGFLAAVLLAPGVIVAAVFGSDDPDVRQALLIVAVAMIAWHTAGFMALSLLSGGSNRAYIGSPLIGLGVFWIVFGGMYVTLETSQIDLLTGVAIAFSVSVLVRALYCSALAYRGVRAGARTIIPPVSP